MRKFSEFAERNKNDPARVALIGSMGGITDNAMLSQLMKGPQTFDAELERSRRLGVALDQDAAAARNLQDSFHGLGQAIDNNARHFVTKITEPGSLSSGERAVSPKGAIGRYQIMPGTAHQYMGAGYDTSKLFDPAENERVARVIIDALMKKYHGDLDAVAIAYHSGDGAADKFLKANRSASVLGPKGQAYLAHERALTANGGASLLAGGTGTTINNSTHIDTLVVNTKADNAPGIGASIRDVLAQNSVANQANTGLK